MPDASTFPSCFDPYLQYAMDTPADATDTSASLRLLMNMDRAPGPLSLLVRLKGGMSAAQFRERVSAMAPRGDEVQIGPIEDGVPYVTVRIPADLFMSAEKVTRAKWFDFWGETAGSVTLSLPVDAARRPASKDLKYDPDRARSRAKTIIGIIDDGCPFAHARLRTGLQSRVLAIWDQERGRHPADVSTTEVFGRQPIDFDYGLEFWRDGDTTCKPQEVGINAWIARHLTPAGSVDEDRCYADAGFISLRRRGTHGSHVTDVLAGRVPTSARVSVNRQTPPSFNEDAPAAWADTDIVFVQIPQDAVNDASGQWLRTQVIDGLRYILSCAGPHTERVVLNLSYGRTTGPHDGTASLEEFLSRMVGVYDGHKRKPRLEVVLPAGNSRASACHATFKSSQQALQTEWTWRIPPDNTVRVMAEVRVRKGDAGHVTDVRLDPPSPYTGPQAKIVTYHGTHDTRWVMVVPPTRPDPQSANVAALHGDWKITISFSRPGVEVHAYVARSDPNMGAGPGAKQSRFVDPKWELSQSASASQSPGGLAAAIGSLVTPSGTLSGIATSNTPGVYIAAGYCIASRTHTPYSSAGPSRGQRDGPDYALPTDESWALTGIPGAGTRSGSVFRLVGTSAAAPQLARLLASGPSPKPAPPRDPNTGYGMLNPP